jgi:hypothetical protein
VLLLTRAQYIVINHNIAAGIAKLDLIILGVKKINWEIMWKTLGKRNVIRKVRWYESSVLMLQGLYKICQGNLGLIKF